MTMQWVHYASGNVFSALLLVIITKCSRVQMSKCFDAKCSRRAFILLAIPFLTLSTVISVIMPPPHFYRKYAPPFFDGSFLNFLR